MAMRVEIKCINKTDRMNPHERIQFVGGVNPNGTRWKLALSAAVAGVLDGTYDFRTQGGGRSVDVVVAYHNGNPYLKTVVDGIQSDNLLALGECP